jgi:ADP-ribosyl-[dinitrogen reductase] hydrolase
MISTIENAITGCILGTAVGDAVGLPCEGISRRRQQKLFPVINSPNLFLGRGMVSDDTEHTCMVAQALIGSAGDVELFTRILARQLRGWILCLPVGTGMATLKACLRLCVGISPERSGVFFAGNGPAMRSAIIGVCYGSDLEKMRVLVRANTRITHTDPKAEWGAFAVALAAHFARTEAEMSPHEYSRRLRELLGDEANELLVLVEQAIESVVAHQSTQEFAASIGCDQRVTGYILHTVPVALHACFRYPDNLRTAILETVRCGGDTDSTAAVVGGIIGARVGRAGVADEWLFKLFEWPRSVSWMQNLAGRLAEVATRGNAQKPLPLFVLSALPRNILLFLLALLHIARRALPPY